MKEHLTEAAKASPALTTAGLQLWGMPLNEWVLILTAVYTVFLIVDKGWSLYQRWKDKRDGQSN